MKSTVFSSRDETSGLFSPLNSQEIGGGLDRQNNQRIELIKQFRIMLENAIA
jgi:hypothetical protein